MPRKKDHTSPDKKRYIKMNQRPRGEKRETKVAGLQKNTHTHSSHSFIHARRFLFSIRCRVYGFGPNRGAGARATRRPSVTVVWPRRIYFFPSFSPAFCPTRTRPSVNMRATRRGLPLRKTSRRRSPPPGRGWSRDDRHATNGSARGVCLPTEMRFIVVFLSS